MSFEAKEVRKVEIQVKMDDVEPLHDPPKHLHPLYQENAQYQAANIAEKLLLSSDVITQYLNSHLEIESVQVYDVTHGRFLLMECSLPDREERKRQFKEDAWDYVSKRMKEERKEDLESNKSPDWYKSNIEPKIRKPVRLLRNAGINTTSSCGHNLWIECETYDPNEEIAVISDVLMSNGISNFRIESVHVHNEKNEWMRCMTVKFPDAEGNYVPQMK